MKPICVLIPHYRRSEELIRCVDTLQACNDPSLFDVLIIDDHSPNEEDTASALKHILSKHSDRNNIVAYTRDTNGGFTINVNSGIRFLLNIRYQNNGNGYQYVMLLNNDAVFVKPNGLQLLMDGFIDPCKVGIVMQNAGCWCKDSIWPTKIGENEPYRRDLHPLEARNTFRINLPGETAWYEDHVGFWGTMIRLDMFEKYGLFEEDFKVVCQDSDFCWRIQKYGWKTKVIGEHILDHHGKTHVDIKPREDIEAFHNADQALIREIWANKYN